MVNKCGVYTFYSGPASTPVTLLWWPPLTSQGRHMPMAVGCIAQNPLTVADWQAQAGKHAAASAEDSSHAAVYPLRHDAGRLK